MYSSHAGALAVIRKCWGTSFPDFPDLCITIKRLDQYAKTP